MAKIAETLTPEQQNFRNAMSKLAAAVNIVTTQGEAGTCGITATAVCSITDTPPTVLVCVNRNSQMNTVFKQNKQVCINVLSAEQQVCEKVQWKNALIWKFGKKSTNLITPRH